MCLGSMIWFRQSDQADGIMGPNWSTPPPSSSRFPHSHVSTEGGSGIGRPSLTKAAKQNKSEKGKLL